MENFSARLYSPEVLEFVKSCRDFCAWIDELGFSGSKKFLEEGLGRLTMLYSRMIVIPVLEPPFNESWERSVTEEDWSGVYRKIANILGPLNDFSDIPDSEEYDRSEFITRKISEDIADIYQDIRDFLEIFRNSPEEIMHDALWECQSLFESNWGEKLLRVSRAMHKLYSSPGPGVSGENEFRQDESSKNIDTTDWFITKRQKDLGKEERFIPE
jgi:hypothetical protein